MFKMGASVQVDVDRVLADVKELYRSEKLFQAGRLLAGLLEGRGDTGKEIEERIRASEELNRIQTYCNESLALLKSFGKSEDRSGEGWSLSYEGQKVKVWHRADEGSPFHTMLSESELNADMMSLMTLVYESDFHSEIFDFMRSSDLIYRPARSQKIIRTVYKCPWPFKDRDSVMHGLAVDGLDEDNCVLVLLRDIDSERDGYPGIEPLQESVRITVRIAGLLFQPTSRKTTRVLNIANVDFHLPIQPAPVVNWASRAIFRSTLKILESKAQTIKELPHSTRMRSDPIYPWMRTMFEDFYNRQGWSVALTSRSTSSVEKKSE